MINFIKVFILNIVVLSIFYIIVNNQVSKKNLHTVKGEQVTMTNKDQEICQECAYFDYKLPPGYCCDDGKRSLTYGNVACEHFKIKENKQP